MFSSWLCSRMVSEMKQNRSNRYTTGVCDIINNDRNKRLCFFEVDEADNAALYFRICTTYKNFRLDYLVHRTLMGWHWLSPTIVTLAEWKSFHKALADVNKKCPMTCLRVEPNKYPAEDQIWYNHYKGLFNTWSDNSIEMSNYLDHVWPSEKRFRGDVHGTIKIVRYPLPCPAMKL